MRVLTWNVLTHSVPAAPSWAIRCRRVADRVAALRPTVIGTQEASAAMLDALVARLPDAYRWVGEADAPTRRAGWSTTRAP